MPGPDQLPVRAVRVVFVPCVGCSSTSTASPAVAARARWWSWSSVMVKRMVALTPPVEGSPPSTRSRVSPSRSPSWWRCPALRGSLMPSVSGRGAARRVQHGEQGFGAGGGEFALDVGGPVGSLGHGEGADAFAVGLVGQDAVLVVQVGDAPGRGRELTRIQGGGVLDQVAFDDPVPLRGDRRRELVDRADDDPGVGGGQHPGRFSGGDGGEDRRHRLPGHRPARGQVLAGAGPLLGVGRGDVRQSPQEPGRRANTRPRTPDRGRRSRPPRRVRGSRGGGNGFRGVGTQRRGWPASSAVSSWAREVARARRPAGRGTRGTDRRTYVRFYRFGRNRVNRIVIYNSDFS